MPLRPELVERRVGFVYSEEGLYRPGEIEVTLEPGVRLQIGEFLVVEHPSIEGVPVFYQVTEVPLRRKARDYEEDLLRAGELLRDDYRNYPRARAEQYGYFEDVEALVRGEVDPEDDLRMLAEHIRPLAEVFKPREGVVGLILKPSSASVELGTILPSSRLRLHLDAAKLARRGLLVVGGVGTGKTTTLLTVLVRFVRAVRESRGVPRVIVIDKDGEYATPELLSFFGEGKYVVVDVSAVAETFPDRDALVERLWKLLSTSAFGTTDRRKAEVRRLEDVIRSKAATLHGPPYAITGELLDALQEELRRRAYNLGISSALGAITAKLEELKRVYSSRGRLEDLLDGPVELIILDLSRVRDFEPVFNAMSGFLRSVYDRALRNPAFGAVIVMDEAHLFCPERGGIELTRSEALHRLRDAIELIATTGPRNGVVLFVATQRLSLLSKTLVTQAAQNIIAHRVEDVDLARLKEVMGEVADVVRYLPRGVALVKASAAGLRAPVIVKVDQEMEPASTGKTAFERFLEAGVLSGAFFGL